MQISKQGGTLLAQAPTNKPIVVQKTKATVDKEQLNNMQTNLAMAATRSLNWGYQQWFAYEKSVIRSSSLKFSFVSQIFTDKFTSNLNFLKDDWLSLRAGVRQRRIFKKRWFNIGFRFRESDSAFYTNFKVCPNCKFSPNCLLWNLHAKDIELQEHYEVLYIMGWYRK